MKCSKIKDEINSLKAKILMIARSRFQFWKKQWNWFFSRCDSVYKACLAADLNNFAICDFSVNFCPSYPTLSCSIGITPLWPPVVTMHSVYLQCSFHMIWNKTRDFLISESAVNSSATWDKDNTTNSYWHLFRPTLPQSGVIGWNAFLFLEHMWF